ncbi:MAG TPA: hypothetical protein VE860_00910, partial [Chthoniobacterales bacterium]|nr:hypothetical protein [Chthoniobacterales bacterium]
PAGGLLGIGLVLLLCLSRIGTADAAGSEATPNPEPQADKNTPPGMVWIPEGTFLMGTDDTASFPKLLEAPLRIYPGGIETRVAWHEVPGKKKKDVSSPVGTVDQGFLQMCHFPSLQDRIYSIIAGCSNAVRTTSDTKSA